LDFFDLFDPSVSTQINHGKNVVETVLMLKIFRDEFHSLTESRILNFLRETEEVLDSFLFGLGVVNNMLEFFVELLLGFSKIIFVLFHLLLDVFIDVPLAKHVVELV
jgi:hypothetical protein